MINIDDRAQELINSTNEMAQETFENPSKMRDFLKTLATMYNTSYNNILLLKSQRDNVSFIATKEEYQKYNKLTDYELEQFPLFFDIANAMGVLQISHLNTLGELSEEDKFWYDESEKGLEFSNKEFWKDIYVKK